MKDKNILKHTYIISIFLLIIYGLVILASASSVFSYNKFANIYYLTLKQLFSILIGIFVFIFASIINLDIFKKYSFFWYIFSIIILSLVFVPNIGFVHAQAKRWITFGNFVIQPTEFIKIIFILIFTSFFLSKKINLKKFKKGVLKVFALALPIFILVVAQPDLDGALLIFISFLTIMYLVGVKFSHIALIILISLTGFLSVLFIYPERMQRIQNFIFKNFSKKSEIERNYHLYQAREALSYGGFWGRGYTKGVQKFGFLPEAYGDSIFAIIIEELGFVGGVVLFLLYITIVISGLNQALKIKDNYRKIVASTFLVFFISQVFVNISANIGLIPFSGLTLPLVSYGGSSIISTLFGLGIVYNVIKK